MPFDLIKIGVRPRDFRKLQDLRDRVRTKAEAHLHDLAPFDEALPVGPRQSGPPESIVSLSVCRRCRYVVMVEFSPLSGAESVTRFGLAGDKPCPGRQEPVDIWAAGPPSPTDTAGLANHLGADHQIMARLAALTSPTETSEAKESLVFELQEVPGGHGADDYETDEGKA